jgi:hypothetical protein
MCIRTHMVWAFDELLKKWVTIWLFLMMMIDDDDESEWFWYWNIKKNSICQLWHLFDTTHLMLKVILTRGEKKENEGDNDSVLFKMHIWYDWDH